MHRQTDRQAGKQKDTETDRQTDKETERQTERQTDRETDRQTDRQTETDRQTDAPTHTVTQYTRGTQHTPTHTVTQYMYRYIEDHAIGKRGGDKTYRENLLFDKALRTVHHRHILRRSCTQSTPPIIPHSNAHATHISTHTSRERE